MEVFIHGENILHEAEFHEAISRALDFPDHYGRNLDALWDVLTTDIERPILLIWKNSECSKQALGKRYHAIRNLLLDVMQQDKKWGLIDKFEVCFD